MLRLFSKYFLESIVILKVSEASYSSLDSSLSIIPIAIGMT